MFFLYLYRSCTTERTNDGLSADILLTCTTQNEEKMSRKYVRYKLYWNGENQFVSVHQAASSSKNVQSGQLPLTKFLMFTQ